MRDLFLQLAVSDVFRAKWSADIHREWIEALLRNQPERDRAKLERTRRLMDEVALDSLVTGVFCSAVRKVRARAPSSGLHLATLTRQGLVATAGELHSFAELL